MSSVIITLNPNIVGMSTVTLDNGIPWIDKMSWSPIAAEVTDTLGGGQVIQLVDRGQKGRPITFQTTDGVGYQTYETVNDLKDLMDIDDERLEIIVTIQEGGASTTVACRPRWEDSPVIEASPVIAQGGVVPSTTWYNVTIKLQGIMA